MSSISGGDIDGETKALAFDSSNNILYAGGSFTRICGIDLSRIGQYDPVTNTWSKVGAGMDGGGIYTLTLDNRDGTLYAGGFFLSAGETTWDDTIVNRIAKR